MLSIDRHWSSALKKVWYAVLVYRISTVSRYSTSLTTHAFHPLHYRYSWFYAFATVSCF